METVIGIDIGTQSTKALVLDGNGRILAEHSRGYRVDTPRPLWAEQWPDVWWEAVLGCLSACLSTPGINPLDVKGLCVSSLYGGSGIPVDDDIEPLHPCLIWMDRRAEAQVKWVKEHINLTRLGDITGNGVDSYYGFTKMMWLKAERPDVWEQTRYLLPPNSYVNYLLSGEIAIDHSSAGNIGGIYDLEKRAWSTEMLEALGIDRDKLPSRLVSSATSVGGMINRRADASLGLISMPHVLNGDQEIYTFGGALTAGASVSWYVDTFCGEDKTAAVESGSAFERLEPPARELPPGANGLLFLPYLMGERSPVWDAHASAGFIGLSLYHQRHHLYRAVLEGVTFALRHNMEAGTRQGVALDDHLIVVGGATQSDLWMQIIADVTRMPVYTYRESVEAALGAGLLAGQACGLLDLAKPLQHGTLVERAMPYETAACRYDELFTLYCQLYPALKPVMHRLNTSHTQSE